MIPTLSIEKGIPIPPDCRAPGKQKKYPFDAMEVGDSFLSPIPEGRTPSQCINIITAAASAYRNKNKNEFKARMRAVEGGIRVWRVQ